jgi:pimeloyl-ACP methyl ester carboxylesterase
MNAPAGLLDNIHVERWGEKGPRVVMVHGGAQGTSSAGHRNFHMQEALAAEGWQVLVPDRPGHGQSPHPGRGDDAEADAAWVAELLGDGAHLVGHSYGGLTALAAAARRPEAVHSLALIEPALLQVATSAPAVRKLLFSMARTMILPYRPATKAKRVMKLLGIPDVFALEKDDHDSLGKALKAGKFPAKKKMNAWLALVRDRRIPLLTISAGSNAAFDAACEIVAQKGGGRHEIVPMPHHFPQWSPEVFNPLVDAFWREAETRQ